MKVFEHFLYISVYIICVIIPNISKFYQRFYETILIIPIKFETNLTMLMLINENVCVKVERKL